MAVPTVSVPSFFSDDTQFFHKALHNWQERNHDTRDFRELSPAEQSAIVLDAQRLKQIARAPITIDEVLAASSRPLR